MKEQTWHVLNTSFGRNCILLEVTAKEMNLDEISKEKKENE